MNETSKSLDFDFEEEPSDLDESDFSANPLPELTAEASSSGDQEGQMTAGFLPIGHVTAEFHPDVISGYYPSDHLTAGHPHMTHPPGVLHGPYPSAVQTTQTWKTYRLLAHCIVTRDFVISGPTDMIGGIHPGNMVVAREHKGARIRVRIPTYGWYGTKDYLGEEFGWMDLRSPTGEPLAVEMQRQLPIIPAPGTIVVSPQEEVVYPTAPAIGHPTINVHPQALPSSPLSTGYSADRELKTPKLRYINRQPHAVYQPASPKDLPDYQPVHVTPPSEKDNDNNAVEPNATHVSSKAVAATAALDSTGVKKLRPPMMRNPLMPVRMVPNNSAVATTTTTAMDKNPAKRTAVVQSTGGTPVVNKPKYNRNGSRGRRRGVYRDKHQALVSHTPGVILYPRDPVTGHVIIPKHLVAAHRKTRRPPCRGQRRNNWGKKHHGKHKA